MRYLIYIITLVLVSSCSNYQKLVKSGTPTEKLEAAKKYYAKKDFIRAQPLLEELLGLYFGKPEREEIYYLYAYSYFGNGEFLLAGYHFNNFAQTYALSPKREETVYMSSVCKYKKSMPFELDQSQTKGAINSLQAFINQYPNSQYVADCNDKIDQLRSRVLEKIYRNAKLYHSLGYYKSAMVACSNAVEDYPDMINRSELGFLVVDASYLYAMNSVEKKQEERFKSTLEKIIEFNKEFGLDSKYAKEISKVKKNTETELSKLK